LHRPTAFTVYVWRLQVRIGTCRLRSSRLLFYHNGPNAPQDVWVYAAPLSSGLLSSSIAAENAVGLRAF
jgi:hypothetical protein